MPSASDNGASLPTSSDEHLILIGTHGFHIHGLLFDPVKKSLRKGKSFKTSQDPSWLTPHPSIKDVIYANGHVQGKAFALRLTDAEGGLEVLSEASTGGAGPTHIAIHPEAGVILAHYKSGNATTVPISSDGHLTSDTHVSNFSAPHVSFSHPRQEAPHAHQAVIHEPSQDVFVPDLGSNKVWRLRWHEPGELRPVEGGSLDGFKDGDGPRHMAFHPDDKHAYTLNELSSTITVHSLDRPSEPLSSHTILPPGDTEKNNGPSMLASEIVILPALKAGGKLLLIASNRDSPNPEGDALALFSVDPQDGSKVTRGPQPYVLGGGKHLRGVAADKSGRYICVTARNSNGVIIYERVGEEGLEISEVTRIEGLENPVCPLWIEQ